MMLATNIIYHMAHGAYEVGTRAYTLAAAATLHITKVLTKFYPNYVDTSCVSEHIIM